MGKRYNVDELEANVDEAGFESLKGWIKPCFDERFEVEDADEIILAGKRRGFEVSGSVVESVSIWDAYHLEMANRKVMKAFKYKTLIRLMVLTESSYHRCPAIDFTEDPKKLKLVKIDLPEENWFALSLE
ncbi:hypothetical protein JCM5353_004908 [Sporobolomyces roseus]